MERIAYHWIKFLRLFMAFLACFLILWVVPFPDRSPFSWSAGWRSLLQEFAAVLVGLYLAGVGFYGYFKDYLDYDSYMYYGLFGLIISGYVIKEWVGL